MGRSRKPTRLLELNGALKHDPQRYRDRADEPRPTAPVGDPPAEFAGRKRETEIWTEFVIAAPKGLLTRCDRYLLANACRIQALIEQGNCSMSMHSCLRRYMVEMGISAAAQRVVQEPNGVRGSWN
jgi:hypothetical protein